MLRRAHDAVRDVRWILLRRRWLVLTPLALGAVAGALEYRSMPRYRAEALIVGDAQRMRGSDGTSDGPVEIRWRSFSDQVLSRPRLQRIIEDLDLYKEQRGSGIMDDAVQRMRRDIDIAVDGKQPSYRVAYTNPDPTVAQKVTERLAALYLVEQAGLKKDPVSLPRRPQNQNARLAVLMGAPLSGLALGVLLVGFLGYHRLTFTCEEDVARLLPIPVLALIPNMEGEDEPQARRGFAGRSIASEPDT